jgi:hypothetical protein
MQYTEENNYPKAVVISTVVMAIFMAISYFIIFGNPIQEEVGTGGIVVNYGTVPEGMGNDYMSIEEPSVDPNANLTPPDKVVPNVEPTPTTPSSESSEKTVVTQDMEEAPVVNTTSKKTAETPSTSPETKESKPTVNVNALYKGKKNTGTGAGDGTGTTPGNQGDPDGDPLAPNYGEGGSGNGSVRLSLASRSFVNMPTITDNGQSSGRIAVEIRVDKNGEVVYARAGAKGTTLSDLNLWRKCEQAVMGSRLNQLESAPDVQIGIVVFNFKVK